MHAVTQYRKAGGSLSGRRASGTGFGASGSAEASRLARAFVEFRRARAGRRADVRLAPLVLFLRHGQ